MKEEYRREVLQMTRQTAVRRPSVPVRGIGTAKTAGPDRTAPACGCRREGIAVLPALSEREPPAQALSWWDHGEVATVGPGGQGTFSAVRVH